MKSGSASKKKAARKSKKQPKKIIEITLAEDLANRDLNQAARANAGNPYFGDALNKNSPTWLKLVYFIVAALVIGFFLSILFIVILSFI